MIEITIKQFIYLPLVEKSQKLNKADRDTIFSDELLPHADALFNFGYSLALDENDANDLVQETFLKAYRFIDSYEPGSNGKAWLFQILKNAFINEYRKKARKPSKVDFEDFREKQQLEKQAERIDISEDVFSHMIGDEVTRALNNLPVDFRTAIILADLEGFTYEEIAKITDIPIGTVRSRLFRARNLMKEELREYAKGQGYKEKR